MGNLAKVLGVSNSQKISVAFWFRVPAVTMADGTGSIFEAGRNNGLGAGANVFGNLLVNIIGTENGLSWTRDLSVPHGGPASPSTGNSSLIASAGTDAGIIVADTWYFVGFSADTSGTTVFEGDINNGNNWTISQADMRLYLVVNNTNYSAQSASYLDGTISANGVILPMQPAWPSDTFTVSGTDLAINGFEFGIPAATANLAPDYNGDMIYSDFFVWVGQTIDFTDAGHRANFISPTGAQVSSSTAVAAYGVPDILFKGDKDHFIINQGTEGAFTLSGTDDNFDPGPTAA